MKKYFFLIIILFVFVLSGCGSQSVETADQKSEIKNQNNKVEIGNQKSEIDSSSSKSEDAKKSEDQSEEKSTEQEKFEVTDTKGWQTLKRDEFEIKLHGNWYYNVYHKTDKESGIERIIGFATSSLIWKQEPPFTVELAIVENDVPNTYVGYMKDLGEKDGRDYFLRTEDKEAYGDLVDMMASTFKFVTKEDE